MEHDIIIICRLCLKICKDGFNNIDENIQEALNCFLLHVNLDISHDPVICTTCVEELKKCFDFKTDCLQKRNFICMKLRNTDVNSEIACLKENTEDSVSFISKIDTCVFCMEMVNLDSSVTLKNEEKNMIATLDQCFSELDLNIAEDSITCTSCYKSMQILMSFINSCLVAEERIKEYCNIEGTNSEGQIELTAMLNFTFKNQLKSLVHGYNVAKVEKDRNQLDNADKIEIKIEIKSENYVKIEEQELPDIKEESSIKTEDDDGRSKIDIEQNMKIYRTKRPAFYKCHTCSYQTYSEHRLRRHTLTCKHATQKELHACNLCPYWTDHKSHMRRHMLTHKSASEVTMHKCGICAFETKYKNSLPKHMLIHKDATEVKMFKCQACAFQTKYKQGMQKHMLIHKSMSEVRIFKCDRCPYQSKLKDCLRTHMHTHKNSSEVTKHKCKSTSEVTVFKCDKCQYQSKYRNDFQQHMLMHKTPSEVTM